MSKPKEPPAQAKITPTCLKAKQNDVFYIDLHVIAYPRLSVLFVYRQSEGYATHKMLTTIGSETPTQQQQQQQQRTSRHIPKPFQ